MINYNVLFNVVLKIFTFLFFIKWFVVLGLRTNQPNISASENTEESLFNEYEDVDEDDDDDDDGDDDSSDESDIETEVIEDDEWFNTIENFTTGTNIINVNF